MSVSSKVITSVATALAGNELRNVIGNIDLDEVLGQVGLARRRSHMGQSLLFMGAGIVIGGAATVVLASSRKKDVISWLSKRMKEAADTIEEVVFSVEEEIPTPQKADNNHHQPNPVDAAL